MGTGSRPGAERAVKRLLAGLMIVGALVLAGCSSIDEGYITKKEYKPAYQTSTIICAAYGKYGCTVWVPHTNYYPESWWFDIVEADSADGGEPKTGWVYVGPETFEKYKEGDYYKPDPK